MSIDRLRELAKREPGSWVAESLEYYFSHASKGCSMEEAFGISPGAWQQPWWRKEEVCKRDEAIIELAQTLDEKNNSKKAKRVREMLLRYSDARWKHDYPHGISGNANKERELFYTILESNGGRILGERAIRDILKNV